MISVFVLVGGFFFLVKKKSDYDVDFYVKVCVGIFLKYM